VLTKADKVKPTDVEALIARISDCVRRRPAAHPVILATSAETGDGLPALRGELARLAGR